MRNDPAQRPREPRSRWLALCQQVVFSLVLMFATGMPALAQGLAAGIQADFAVLDDIEGSYRPADIFAGLYDEQFVRVEDGRVDAKSSGSALWLRLQLRASSNVSTPRILVLGPAYVDELVLYKPEADWRSQRVRSSSGDAVPFAEKPFPSRMHVFKLPDPAGTYYVRATSEGPLNLNWEITTEPDFIAEERLTGTAYAMLLGVLATMILFNLGVFLAIGDRTYVFYVLYHIFAAFLIFSMAGYTSQYLLPYLSNSTNLSIPLSLVGMCFFGVLFVHSFLDLKHTLPRYSLLLRGTAVVVLLLAIPGFALPYSAGSNFTILAAILVLIAMAIGITAAIVNGITAARYLVITFGCAVLPGSLAAIGYAFGLLPETVFAVYSIEISTVAETILISLFMAYRIKVSEDEKRDAQQRNIELHRSFNERMLAKQEEERSRIARELHDSVGPNLSALKMHLQSIEDSGTTGGSPMLSNAQSLNLVQSTIDEVRHLSHNLHPRQLDDVSLSNAVAMFTRQFQGKSAPSFKLQLTEEEPRLPEETKIHLYRLAQEAIQNVVSHAHASLCLVSLGYQSDVLTLSIRDNGDGFDTRQVDGDGLGMTSMADRANIIRAALSVDSAPGEGTQVTVTLATNAEQ